MVRAPQEKTTARAQVHVLVADDDPLLIALIDHYFCAEGFRVSTATNGDEALVAIRSLRPDIVILDSMMPVMGGAEVLRRLRAEGRLGATKVVMLTTLSDERQAVSAFQLGAADFVAKPFSPSELVSRVARLASAHAR